MSKAGYSASIIWNNLDLKIQINVEKGVKRGEGVWLGHNRATSGKPLREAGC